MIIKVICINNKNSSLELNKIYDVSINRNKDSYIIRNVDDSQMWYDLSRFKKLEDIREEKLNKILNG